MEYGIIKALCWYRIVAAIFAAAVVGFTYDKLEFPTFAIMASGALIVISITIQQISRRDPSILMSSSFVVSELIFASVITVLGGIFYAQGTTSSTLAFGSQYILASVLMAGVAYGIKGGVAGGIIIGLARTVAMLINGNELTASRSLSLLSTTVTFCLAGALVGGVVTILRRAGGELSQAHARDNIARTLHDGVLQTLVIIQKRSKEPEIIDLAANQEKQLRSFLFTNQSKNTDSVVRIHEALEEVSEKFAKLSSIPVAIVVAPDIGDLSKTEIKALSGACLECLTNVAKHSEATSVNIYCEPIEDEIVVSIRDDGKGFDVERALSNEVADGENSRQGLKGSVIARVEDVGGSVKIKSGPESGTEVEIRLPRNVRAEKSKS